MKKIVVIPAYNEHKHIALVVKETRQYVDEVIVVDDGSEDNTVQLAREAGADLVLRHIVNMGKGIALKTGIEAAIKKNAVYIVTIDGDGQHNPKDIPRLFELIKKGNYDIVIGSRSINRNMPVIFKVGNIFLNIIFRSLFKENIKDTQSGFRIIRAEIYEKIKWESPGYSVETEMLANAGMRKLKCAELPIETKYVDKYKGTTILDGFNIFFKMILWKLRRA